MSYIWGRLEAQHAQPWPIWQDKTFDVTFGLVLPFVCGKQVCCSGEEEWLPATKSLMLESISSTRAAPGYCFRKLPRSKFQTKTVGVAGLDFWNLDGWVLFAFRNQKLPVCKVVFVQMQESWCDVTGHPLEKQWLWGDGLVRPAASEVTLHISLDTDETNETAACYNLRPLECSLF